MPRNNRRNNRRYRNKLTLKNLDKRIDKIENEQELKYHPSNNQGSMNLGVALPNILNGMQDGDTGVTRTGAQVVGTSLRIKGEIESHSDVLEDTSVRCIIFWYVQPKGQIPTIIGPPGNTTTLLVDEGITDPTFLQYNMNTVINSRNFDIVWDKRWTFNPKVARSWATTGTDPSSTVIQSVVPVTYQIDKKFKFRKKVIFAAATGNPTSFTQNSLWMVWLTDKPAATAPRRDIVCRFYFKDPQ